MHLELDGHRAFVLDHGHGEPLVCLHAGLSASAQWRPLIDRLGDGHRVVAPDLFGEGHTRVIPASDGAGLLAAESALALLAIEGVGTPVHLVGHSYGGVVALRAALAQPSRLATLTLIEPVVFPLLAIDPAVQLEVDRLRLGCLEALAAGAIESGVSRFYEYWSGSSWSTLPSRHREGMMAGHEKLRLGWSASWHWAPDPAALGRLAVPTLLVSGTRSPAAGRVITRALAALLPHAEEASLEGAGHLSPTTDAAALATRLAAHVARGRHPEPAPAERGRRDQDSAIR
jgi:pimeloyl-ACP methyl ester carboxylesterase